MLKVLAPEEPPIALVDDDPALLQSLVFAFETEGYRVASFASGEALLEAAPTPVGCYIVDQNLPGVSGITLIERLRATGDRAPAILTTTHPAPALRVRAATAGVEIVEKPLLDDVLGRRVRRLLTGG